MPRSEDANKRTTSLLVTLFAVITVLNQSIQDWYSATRLNAGPNRGLWQSMCTNVVWIDLALRPSRGNYLPLKAEYCKTEPTFIDGWTVARLHLWYAR
jgi:hypothetical protein